MADFGRRPANLASRRLRIERNPESDEPLEALDGADGSGAVAGAELWSFMGVFELALGSGAKDGFTAGLVLCCTAGAGSCSGCC